MSATHCGGYCWYYYTYRYLTASRPIEYEKDQKVLLLPRAVVPSHYNGEQVAFKFHDDWLLRDKTKLHYASWSSIRQRQEIDAVKANVIHHRPAYRD